MHSPIGPEWGDVSQREGALHSRWASATPCESKSWPRAGREDLLSVSVCFVDNGTPSLGLFLTENTGSDVSTWVHLLKAETEDQEGLHWDYKRYSSWTLRTKQSWLWGRVWRHHAHRWGLWSSCVWALTTMSPHLYLCLWDPGDLGYSYLVCPNRSGPHLSV